LKDRRQHGTAYGRRGGDGRPTPSPPRGYMIQRGLYLQDKENWPAKAGRHCSFERRRSERISFFHGVLLQQWTARPLAEASNFIEFNPEKAQKKDADPRARGEESLLAGHDKTLLGTTMQARQSDLGTVGRNFALSLVFRTEHSGATERFGRVRRTIWLAN